MLHEEIGRIECQGEQVCCPPARNALASRVIIDQLSRLLSKDNEEVNAQVKRLHAMLDVGIMTDPALDLGDMMRDQDPTHRQSPCRDSAISLSRTPYEHGWVREIFGMSSAMETLMAGLRIIAKRETATTTSQLDVAL
jgi:hypothetical protein